MSSRWWHQHDDLAAAHRRQQPTTVAVEVTASSKQPRSSTARRSSFEQLQPVSASAMRADAEPFKPQGPGPGFDKAANPPAPKAALPKAWEYEDPLKDVHGPSDAAQIINWFAQVCTQQMPQAWKLQHSSSHELPPALHTIRTMPSQCHVEDVICFMQVIQQVLAVSSPLQLCLLGCDPLMMSLSCSQDWFGTDPEDQAHRPVLDTAGVRARGGAGSWCWT